MFTIDSFKKKNSHYSHKNNFQLEDENGIQILNFFPVKKATMFWELRKSVLSFMWNINKYWPKMFWANAFAAHHLSGMISYRNQRDWINHKQSICHRSRAYSCLEKKLGVTELWPFSFSNIYPFCYRVWLSPPNYCYVQTPVHQVMTPALYNSLTSTQH